MTTQRQCKDKIENAFSGHHKVASAYDRALEELYDAATAALDANAAKLSADERLARARKAERDAFCALMAARQQTLADTAAANAHANGLLIAELENSAAVA